MSTYRSANTRQSQAQSQSQVYSTIQKRNQYAKQIPQLRPGQNRQPNQGLQASQLQGQGQGQFQRRRGTSIASTSVYDPEEGQPIKLTIKQAITLITLRLGKLEVFANESKVFPKGDFEDIKNGEGVDKDFLLSIVTRLDNMEKAQHNLRVEMENFRKSLNEPQNQLLDEPVILDIFDRLDVLDNFTKQIQESTQNSPIEPVVENVDEFESVNSVIETKYPIYDPTIIEPYQIKEELPEQLTQPQIDTQLPQPPQVSLSQAPQPPVSQPLQVQLEPSTPVSVDQNPKTPRKRTGKKISI